MTRPTSKRPRSSTFMTDRVTVCAKPYRQTRPKNVECKEQRCLFERRPSRQGLSVIGVVQMRGQPNLETVVTRSTLDSHTRCRLQVELLPGSAHFPYPQLTGPDAFGPLNECGVSTHCLLSHHQGYLALRFSRWGHYAFLVGCASE
ncbi:protein of unknown function [Cupriavidus taiwanensis]|nr:protein of unknown function [Cupriavidus taiwanensis]